MSNLSFGGIDAEHLPVLSEIAAERERQIAKGYTVEWDDAMSYSLSHEAIERIEQATAATERTSLIQAAALIVAEIARLDRAKMREGE